jgi:hypothetical protein
MKRVEIARIVLLSAATLSIIGGCSLTSNEPDGSDLAAQSCTTDLLAVSPASKIVAVGLPNKPLNKELIIDLKVAEERVLLDQNRSILSAKAAAANEYWQPLADAWALEEALARATFQSLSETITDAEGKVSVNSSVYDSFISNVNVDFAAATKDTYCRIAFVKQNLEIKYED